MFKHYVFKHENIGGTAAKIFSGCAFDSGLNCLVVQMTDWPVGTELSKKKYYLLSDLLILS